MIGNPKDDDGTTEALDPFGSRLAAVQDVGDTVPGCLCTDGDHEGDHEGYANIAIKIIKHDHRNIYKHCI